MAGATPVLAHGADNIDSGINLAEASENDVFLGMANEMLGIEPEPEEEQEQPSEEAEEVSQEETETEEEDETEEEADEESDEEEEVSDEEEAADTEEEEPESEVFIVDIDGQEEEVSADELRDGYLRNKDYTQKTQELASERTKINDYVAQLEEERNKYTHALEEIINQEKAQLQEYDKIDWAKLKQEDQNQFLILQFEMNEKRAALQTKLDNREKAYEQSLAEKDIQQRDYHAAQNKRAAELVDGWGGEGHQAIVEGLKAQTEAEGFDDGDQELLKHAMVIKLLNKAKEFDEFKAKQEEVVGKKIKRKVPKAVKAGKNEIGDKQTSGKKKFNEAKKRLSKTGDIKDSVEAFQAFI